MNSINFTAVQPRQTFSKPSTKFAGWGRDFTKGTVASTMVLAGTTGIAQQHSLKAAVYSGLITIGVAIWSTFKRDT